MEGGSPIYVDSLTQESIQGPSNDKELIGYPICAPYSYYTGVFASSPADAFCFALFALLTPRNQMTDPINSPLLSLSSVM